MKQILTIAALLITSLCYGQGIWTKSATNTIINRGKDDSVRIIPRDTLPTNNALYNGSPVGNYARIAAKHGRFYFHDSVYNRRVAFYDDILLAPLTPLMTQPPNPIQPSSTVIQAFGLLQSQINTIDGKYIENQDIVNQDANFNIAGQGVFKSIASRPNIIIQRGSADTMTARLSFYKSDFTEIGHIGADKTGNNVDLSVISLKGNIESYSRDTGAIVFGQYNGVGTVVQSGYKAGKWFFTNSPLSVNAIKLGANYTKTIRIIGAGDLDSTYTGILRVGTSTPSGFLAEFNGSVNIADNNSLRWATVATLNRNNTNVIIGSVDGTRTSDIITFNAGSTEKVRIAADGKVGIGTAGATSTLHVAGSLSLPCITAGGSGTLTLNDTRHTVIVTASTLTVAFPSAASFVGREYRIVNYNTGGNVTISSSSTFLRYGSAITTIPNNTTYYFHSDGTNWYVVN